MQKLAVGLSIVIVCALFGCQKEVAPLARRGARGSAVSPNDGTPSPGSTTAPGQLNWDGLTDRPDAVWQF